MLYLNYQVKCLRIFSSRLNGTICAVLGECNRILIIKLGIQSSGYLVGDAVPGTKSWNLEMSGSYKREEKKRKKKSMLKIQRHSELGDSPLWKWTWEFYFFPFKWGRTKNIYKKINQKTHTHTLLCCYTYTNGEIITTVNKLTYPIISTFMWGLWEKLVSSVGKFQEYNTLWSHQMCRTKGTCMLIH